MAPRRRVELRSAVRQTAILAIGRPGQLVAEEGLEPSILSAPVSKTGVYAFHHSARIKRRRRDLNPQNPSRLLTRLEP